MMNFRYTMHQFSLLMLVLSAVLAALGSASGANAIWGSGENMLACWALLISSATGFVLSGALWYFTRTQYRVFGRREALLLVGVGWLIGAAIAGLPFFVWAHLSLISGEGDHAFLNPINCYFEAMSGLTTTGATILTKISTVPPALLFWRSFTHWLGGLGIVVLFVAVLPSLGAGGKKLFRVEAPGPAPEGVRPQIRETARILWIIYLCLTAAETIALRLTGMNWFESLCHTFGTLATGGFSIYDESIAHYSVDPNVNGLGVDIIIIFFMILAGVNFGLYYHFIKRQFISVLKDTELRIYLSLIILATCVMFFALWNKSIVTTAGEHLEPSVASALHHGMFTAVSINTTTGYCTADFHLWPFYAKAVLIALMFIGGSAGSTGGGIKVIRIWITFKIMIAELEKTFRPNVVRPLKIGNGVIDDEMRLATLAYVMGILLIFVFGAFAIKVCESGSGCSITTAATASVATLCNIGPGLEAVGATSNYHWFTNSSKVIMSVLMVVGRLEMFAILVLFAPSFWRSH